MAARLVAGALARLAAGLAAGVVWWRRWMLLAWRLAAGRVVWGVGRVVVAGRLARVAAGRAGRVAVAWRPVGVPTGWLVLGAGQGEDVSLRAALSVVHLRCERSGGAGMRGGEDEFNSWLGCTAGLGWEAAGELHCESKPRVARARHPPRAHPASDRALPPSARATTATYLVL